MGRLRQNGEVNTQEARPLLDFLYPVSTADGYYYYYFIYLKLKH